MSALFVPRHWRDLNGIAPGGSNGQQLLLDSATGELYWSTPPTVPTDLAQLGGFPAWSGAADNQVLKKLAGSNALYWATDLAGSGSASYGAEFVNMLDPAFGVDQTGATDTTAAMNAVLSTYKNVYIPNPTTKYKISGSLIPQSGARIYGGRNTQIQMYADAPVWDLTNKTGVVLCGIQGNNQFASIGGTVTSNSVLFKMHGTTATCSNNYIIQCSGGGGGYYGISYTGQCNYNWVDMSYLFGNVSGFYCDLANPYTYGHVMNSALLGNGVGAYDILMDGCDTGHMANIHCGGGIYLRAANHVVGGQTFSYLQIENTARNVIECGGSNFSVVECAFNGIECFTGAYDILLNSNTSGVQFNGGQIRSGVNIKDYGSRNKFTGLYQRGDGGGVKSIFAGTDTTISGNTFGGIVQLDSTFTGSVSGNVFIITPSIHATAGANANFSGGNIWPGMDATSITAAPLFKKQRAYVGSNIYEAKGTASSADWVLLG